MLVDLFDPRAFSLGMVALVNPCGFALLPAYLGFFLGTNDAETNSSRLVALSRAQIVGLSMATGFITVFALLGIVLSGLLSTLLDPERGYMSWFTIVMGLGLVALGIAMARGFKPILSIPGLDKGTDSTAITSMFLFGVSYALASLSCTIGLFTAVIGTTTTTDQSFWDRFGSFISYAAGMGLLAVVLTVALALGQRSVVNGFRRMLPYVNTISAAALVGVGIYLVLYGKWQLEAPGEKTAWIDTIVFTVEGWQSRATTFISQRSRLLGWVFVAINGAIALGGLWARNRRATTLAP